MTAATANHRPPALPLVLMLMLMPARAVVILVFAMSSSTFLSMRMVITTAAIVMLYMLMLMVMIAAISMAMLRNMPHAGMVVVLATVATGTALGMVTIILSSFNMSMHMSKAAHLSGGIAYIF